MGTDREAGTVTGTWVQTERQEQSLVHGYRQRGRNSHRYMDTDRDIGAVTVAENSWARRIRRVKREDRRKMKELREEIGMKI